MTSAPSAHDGSTFRTSSFCTGGGCVGVAFGAREVQVSDTKRDDDVVLRFTYDEWSAFVSGVKVGEFDFG